MGSLQLHSFFNVAEEGSMQRGGWMDKERERELSPFFFFV